LRVLKNGILKVSGHSRGNTTVGQPGRQADTIVPISKYYGSYATYGTNQKCTQNFEWKPDETSSEALLYKMGLNKQSEHAGCNSLSQNRTQ